MKSIGANIDALQKLRVQKKGLEEKLKALTDQVNTLELQLIEQMDAEETTRGAGKLATVSITQSVKPSVEDWDLFYAYVHRHKYYHLLERRPSVVGCRELFETKGKIPGVVPYTQRKLNIRTL